MFQHILVPTDGTERSQNAIDIAVKLQNLEASQAPEQQITLLHVIETIPGEDSEEFERFYATLKKRAQKNMEALLQDHAQDRDRIKLEIILDNRVQGILDYAASNAVDLILLSSHKIDMNNPAEGWGTISHKVGILAQCPVMLVK
jgi:universal stress protein A